MGKTVVQTALAALLACSVLAPARCGVVSLADVTGASPERTQDDGPGVSFVGYQEPQAPGRRPGVVSLSDVTGLTPEQHATLGGNAYTGLQQYPGSVNLVDANGVNARPPHRGGVVSLSDVTGVAPPHPWPLHPERGYDPQRPYSPCYVPGAGPAFTPPQHPVNPVHLGGARLPRSKRSKRSPEPGVVRLEDVAGPNAGRYPSYGPPAYVRPSYPYYNSYYSWYRPQPYYNVVPLPCFGLWCL